jgi:putative endopeptidase
VLGLDAHRLFDSLVHQVNAFYVPSLNAIVINAGILAPPVFSGLYDSVSRFAKLGMILGHEMSHSIDLSGSNFDQFGSFHPWLSDDAAGRYEHNAQCFVDMYSTKTTLGNVHDGEKTLNENIADVAGFRAAYNAMFEEYRDLKHAKLDAYKRQFFIAYAQLWCKCTNNEAEQRYIKASVHSASDLRVNNVVRQHTDFAAVFQCPSSTIPTTHCTTLS